MIDVIVIGGGPSGAMAARIAAEQGLSTLLIEKHKVPRIKPCGGGVSKKAINIIERRIPKDVIEREIRGFRLISPDGSVFTIRGDEVSGIIVERSKFDHFLLREAEKSGAEIKTEKVVVGLYQERDLVHVKLKNEETLKGKLVIGADGVSGRTAVWGGIRDKFTKQDKAIAFELLYHCNDVEGFMGAPDMLEIQFIKNVLGYGWIFPREKTLNIGIGGYDLNNTQDAKKILNNYVKCVEKTRGVNLGKPFLSRCWRIPGGRPMKKFANHRVWVVGDQGGNVDPFTGEGIYYALASGKLAGELAKIGVTNPSKGQQEFERRWKKQYLKEINLGRQLSRRIHKRTDKFFQMLKYNTKFVHHCLKLATGEITYQQLWREALLKFPIITVRMIAGKLKVIEPDHEVYSPSLEEALNT